MEMTERALFVTCDKCLSDHFCAVRLRGEREDIGPLRARNMEPVVQALRVPRGGDQGRRAHRAEFFGTFTFTSGF